MKAQIELLPLVVAAAATVATTAVVVVAVAAVSVMVVQVQRTSVGQRRKRMSVRGLSGGLRS